MIFELTTKMIPQGDQEQAIVKLVEGLNRGDKYQTLLGVTGSGKTFTIANVLQRVQRPALVISPNKTLVTQLFREFRGFFKNNKIELFISYYDYYQPEAYIPSKDMYIEKDAQINETIERMRISALKSVLTRNDTVVAASVSAIYASGNPDDFRGLNINLEVGNTITRKELTKLLRGKFPRASPDTTWDIKRVGKFVQEAGYSEDAIPRGDALCCLEEQRPPSTRKRDDHIDTECGHEYWELEDV